MFTSKIRTTVLTLIVAGSVGAPALVPAASHAQVNNFGYLKSSEAFKLKTQGTLYPCQPTNPVESGTPMPLPVGPVSSRGGATLYQNAQQETKTTVGPLQDQTCEADQGTEVAY